VVCLDGNKRWIFAGWAAQRKGRLSCCGEARPIRKERDLSIDRKATGVPTKNAPPGGYEDTDGTADDALARERAEKRARENRAREEAAWELFMREEFREVELRKNGQLARLLGDPLPGEPAAALRRLCSEDQRQAEEGLVALMSRGKIAYKRVDELSPEDRPARLAANRARMTWLKERRDGWLV
jgi:hypothetical protein